MEYGTIKSWLIAAAIGVGCFYSYNAGYHKADTKWTMEVQNEYIKTEKANEDKRIAVQGAVSKISAKYQGDLEALEGSTDRIINDLRNDGKRMRVKLKATESKPNSDGRCLIDGRAELDEEFSKRLIRVTQKGDLWIKALQDTIVELQNKEVK
ncbi:Phage endopeptidase Rz [Yersinia phage fPS-19]|uniref:Phage endopeptidase Rz n=10 Tax=Helsettvirus fPS9 TaxID=2733625 RepID=A0A2D0PE29_9CAUD|nr:Rz-like spanin [Yersinia phage fPS-9]SOO46375.1 Phage endopeptidase Rz [Yersinia phage fPS-52]SOO46426.1 Phage endopeptidase Rz [Yersinia phage fPS-19]SOO46477.1 Phage endopeptidase Rz [Yersinia phage fPS-26]SOO46528.1 Phage endopeptidase Rz [Yersinia phage fPS-7]SOO46730.1 Phage endopeptidase Rz [Yersinia phage fPS-50]SOO46781.1 Phage endopeptidase Rz [Yersinia phage fPS-21]SOO46878.1 Phage endopeptidase Rz [Yersinia phage fPS-64]SOR54333.1 Phage endopeptidase Rz [Yersinia phage fPS-10]